MSGLPIGHLTSAVRVWDGGGAVPELKLRTATATRKQPDLSWLAGAHQGSELGLGPAVGYGRMKASLKRWPQHSIYPSSALDVGFYLTFFLLLRTAWMPMKINFDKALRER